MATIVSQPRTSGLSGWTLVQVSSNQPSPALCWESAAGSCPAAAVGSHICHTADPSQTGQTCLSAGGELIAQIGRPLIAQAPVMAASVAAEADFS